MAIRKMTGPDTPGAVRDEYWSKEGRDIWMVTTHVGLVVGLRERNMHDDSDFYAEVWNEEKGHTEEIMYGTTRGWTYPNGAAVDATEEVKAKVAALRAKAAAEARKLAEAREAATPRKGKKARTVRSVKGKHAIEAGVTGTIFWVGEDRYGRSRYSGHAPMRVGFAADDGRKVFIAANAVEVIATETEEKAA